MAIIYLKVTYIQYKFLYAVLFSIIQYNLMIDNLIYDDHNITGWQRFYVEGSGDTEGSLWYCGLLENFSNSEEQTSHLFKAQPISNDLSITFCLDSSVGSNTMFPFLPECEICAVQSLRFHITASMKL